jgi:paraquat-inducible protein A
MNGQISAGHQSIASQAMGADRWLALAAVAVAILHLASLFLPAMQIERLLFFKDTMSIWSTIAVLFKRGEWLIGPLLALFTIIFPLLKLGAIVHLFYSPLLGQGVLHHRLSRLEALGRWSMLDVMIAALLIVSITATKLADARFMPGMYLFSISVIATLLLSRRLGVLVTQFDGEQNP